MPGQLTYIYTIYNSILKKAWKSLNQCHLTTNSLISLKAHSLSPVSLSTAPILEQPAACPLQLPASMFPLAWTACQVLTVQNGLLLPSPHLAQRTHPVPRGRGGSVPQQNCLKRKNSCLLYDNINKSYLIIAISLSLLMMILSWNLGLMARGNPNSGTTST